MTIFTGIGWAILAMLPQQSESVDAKALLGKMMTAIGGQNTLYARKDVTYRYQYLDAKGGADISIESYLFDGELSKAEYVKTTSFLAAVKGKLVQGYDGKSAWATVDGTPITDPQQLKITDFFRKTNYYWFAMMHKMLDPGLNYEYKGVRNFEGIPYDLVEVSFGEGIGDAQDIYLLYINPFTHLVDQFLFTVMDFGIKDPLLMRVQYTDVDGVLLPAVRRYVQANWEATPKNNDWVLEIMTDIQFNTGLTPASFAKP